MASVIRLTIFLVMSCLLVGCAGSRWNENPPVDRVGLAFGTYRVQGKKLPWWIYQGEIFNMVRSDRKARVSDDLLRDKYLGKFVAGGEQVHEFCKGGHDNGAMCAVVARRVVRLEILRIAGVRGMHVARTELVQLFCEHNKDKVKGLDLEVKNVIAEYRVYEVDHLLELFVFGDDARLHDPYGMTWRKEGWAERRQYYALKKRVRAAKGLVGMIDEKVIEGRYQGVSSRGQLMWARVDAKGKLVDVEWGAYRGGKEELVVGEILGLEKTVVKTFDAEARRQVAEDLNVRENQNVTGSDQIFMGED